MNESAAYPTSEKLADVEDAYVTLHQFLDWLSEQDIHLAKYEDVGLRDLWLQPLRERHEGTVLRFFGIDPAALERERRAMLATPPVQGPTDDR